MTLYIRARTFEVCARNRRDVMKIFEQIAHNVEEVNSYCPGTLEKFKVTLIRQVDTKYEERMYDRSMEGIKRPSM